MLRTDNVSKNSSRGASVHCTIKIVILKKKIIFREDRTVEDGHEVQQQRARALGRQGLRLTSISKWAWEPDKVLGHGAIKAEVGFKSS